MADGTVVIDTSLDSSGIETGLAKLGSLAKKGSKIAVAAIGGVTAAIGGIAVGALKAGMDFEAGMSQVAAISGATSEQLEQLTEKAKEMGAKTKFSATESAEAMNYMAMAGWKTEDMLSGIEGIMNLAAASGEELATTSDIVTDALTAFGLSAQDSAHFADVLAAASSNANTNVSMMGETFKYVAPVAGALGFSAEDTATAIGLMANAGIKGSQAGTSLRSMMSRLAKPTAEVQEAMDQLGVALTNSDGSMKSLQGIMVDLRRGFSGLTDAQKAEVASSLAGQEAMSGLLAIVNASEEDFDKLSAAIYNCDGTAEQMAETMQDNLQGKITLAKSALEGFGIQVYESMETPLKSAVEKGTEYINQLSTALAEGGLQGAAETAGGIIADLVTNIAEKAPDMINAAVTVIQSFVQGLIDNKDRILTAAGQIVKALVDGLASLLPKEIGDPIKKVFDGIGKSLKSGGLKKGIDAIVKMFKTLIKVIGQIIDKVGPAIVKILDFIGSKMDAIIPLITGAVTAFLAYKAVTAVIEKVKAAQDALNKSTISHPYVLLATAIAGIVTALATWHSTFSPAAQAATHLKESVEDVGEACEAGGQHIANMMDTINSAESIYGNYADTLFATQEELTNMTAGIDAAQSGISEIYRRESEERNGYTESEIETLQNYYDTLQELYAQQLDIEIKKQEAIQAGIDAEIGAFDGSVAEYRQKQASWLQTAEESKNTQISILEEQKATEIALYQQKAEAEGLSVEETEAHVQEIVDAYGRQKDGVIARYTAMTDAINGKYEELTGGYDEFIRTMTGLSTQYESEQAYHNRVMAGYDQANVKAYQQTINDYIAAGEDANQLETLMLRDSEAEKVRHNGAVAEINDQLNTLLSDSNSQYVQELIAFAGEVAENGGQLTETQSQVISAMVNAWDSMPTDIQDKLVGYLQPAMAAMEADYPAFKGSADMAPAAIRDAWRQLLEDNGAYEATTSVFAGYNTATMEGVTAMTGVTQDAIETLLGQINDGSLRAADATAGITPAMVAAIAGSDLSGQLSGEMQKGAKGLISGLDGLSEGTKSAMANAVQPMLEELENADPELYAAAEKDSTSVLNAIKKALGIHSPSRETRALFKEVGAGGVQGLNDGKPGITSAALELARAAISAIKNADLYHQAFLVGQNFGSGLSSGIAATTSQIAQQAAATVRQAIDAANAEQQAHSPAKETIKVGHNFGEGEAIGIRDKLPELRKAGAESIEAALEAAERRAVLANARAAMDATVQRSVASMSLGRQTADYAGNTATYGDVNQTVNFYQPVKNPVEASRVLKRTAKEMNWR